MMQDSKKRPLKKSYDLEVKPWLDKKETWYEKEARLEKMIGPLPSGFSKLSSSEQKELIKSRLIEKGKEEILEKEKLADIIAGKTTKIKGEKYKDSLYNDLRRMNLKQLILFFLIVGFWILLVIDGCSDRHYYP